MCLKLFMLTKPMVRASVLFVILSFSQKYQARPHSNFTKIAFLFALPPIVKRCAGDEDAKSMRLLS